jgi:SAM-dependent methyltransferase
MPEKQWNLFFRREAPSYLENIFTKNTHAEVDFIVRELGLRDGASVLDIGCGTGRHSLELARRGYRCTGIDQSEEMLAIGRALAAEEGLALRFIQGDASTTRLAERFQHAICICEGAFSLLEVGTDPVTYHEAILDNIHRMLETGGTFLLTALNALRMIREHSDEDVALGRFDVLSMREMGTYPGPDGTEVTVVEKGFLPSELLGLLKGAGFEVLSLWGGTAGSWNKVALSLDEIEIMAVARKGTHGRGPRHPRIPWPA